MNQYHKTYTISANTAQYSPMIKNERDYDFHNDTQRYYDNMGPFSVTNLLSSPNHQR